MAQNQAGKINNIISENLQAAREVRAYNLEEHQTIRFQSSCRDFFNYTLKTVKYNKSLSPIIEVVSAVAITVSLYLIIHQKQ